MQALTANWSSRVSELRFVESLTGRSVDPTGLERHHVSMTDKTLLSARVAGEIRAEMARRRISGRSLASELGVSQAWMSGRLSGATPIDLNDLELIAQGIGVEAVELLSRAPGRAVVTAGTAERGTTSAYSQKPDRVRPVSYPQHTKPDPATRRVVRRRCSTQLTADRSAH